MLPESFFFFTCKGYIFKISQLLSMINAHPSAILVLTNVCCPYSGWPAGGSVWDENDTLETTVVAGVRYYHQHPCIKKQTNKPINQLLSFRPNSVAGSDEFHSLHMWRQKITARQCNSV